ncbi:MAG: hypothetical protein HN370_05115 [Phycisphaerales bacterium]|jgi:hypothetical protein|nr:hypothetical protein [Phycisphaerales bacterium]
MKTTYILVIILASVLLSGCGGNSNEDEAKQAVVKFIESMQKGGDGSYAEMAIGDMEWTINNASNGINWRTIAEIGCIRNAIIKTIKVVSADDTEAHCRFMTTGSSPLTEGWISLHLSKPGDEWKVSGFKREE